jgi:hypothetical protein
MLMLFKKVVVLLISGTIFLVTTLVGLIAGLIGDMLRGLLPLTNETNQSPAKSEEKNSTSDAPVQSDPHPIGARANR